MVDVGHPELGNIKTSNFVSLYPLSKSELGFLPLIKGLKNQITPVMSRKDIHTLLRKEIKKQGIETDEGHFLDKVLHFTLLQEAMEFSLHRQVEQPLSIVANHMVLEELKDFNSFYKMSKKQKEIFKEFKTQVKNQTDKERYTFKGSRDPRKELQELTKTIVLEKDQKLASELSDFVRGMVMLPYKSEDFWNEFNKLVKPKLSDAEQIKIDEFNLNPNLKESYMIYQIIQTIKEHKGFTDDTFLLNKIKSSVWETINVLKRNHSLKNHHLSVSAGDRMEEHLNWKQERREFFSKEPAASEDFSVKGGNYGSIEIIDLDENNPEEIAKWKDIKKQYPDEKSLERPGFTEGFIVNRIKQLLDVNKGKPTIFIDFGGQMAFSTIKLASQFDQEIKSGQLILVASNVLDDYSKIEAHYKKERSETYEMFKNFSPIVKFIQADAQDLQNMEINTVDGNKISLKGNISIIHEMGSISRHGHMNDLDYPLLANTLNENGLIMTSRIDKDGFPIDSQVERRLQMQQQKTKDWTIPEKGATKLSEKWGLTPPIILAGNYVRADKAMIASNNLHQMGLKLVDKVTLLNEEDIEKKQQKRDLNYAFWLRPTALPLKIQQYDGQWIEVPIDSMN